MRTPRREFLKETGLGMAGLALAGSSQASAAAADDQQPIVLGAIGCGGQGTFLATSFARLKNVEVAWVCDVDRGRAEKAAAAIRDLRGQAPKVTQDLRQVLDDRRVDAVTVATPDHWHGPATLLAVEAGKHVYVEKPAAHNIRESRLMIEAARKHQRVVQVGTQSRSSPAVLEAMKRLRDGAIGEVLVAKAWNSQRRANIGRGQPGDPPPDVDYDLWLGPAPAVPFQSNRFHYHWHWWYAFGTGDMGNDGVHDLDIARWGLNAAGHPVRVTAGGGKSFFDDDQEFPDTAYVSFEYPAADGRPKLLVFEQRIWSPYRQEGYENGNAFYGTEGVLLLGKNDGWKLFGPRNKLVEESPPSGMGPPHHQNFIDCIRSGARPNADIEEGHLSAALCHLGNLAVRFGGLLRFDPQAEKILDNDPAAPHVGREYRPGHWAVPRGV